MTQRQIGDVLGVNPATVNRDIQSVANATETSQSLEDREELSVANASDRTAEIIARAIQDAYKDAQVENGAQIDREISKGVSQQEIRHKIRNLKIDGSK
jgi:hypothetical protein